MENQKNEVEYNSAKMWQIMGFPLNNVATNLFMILMTFVSYLAVDGYGILVSVAAITITASRIFDGFTDPIIGVIIDKTETKFGKFRVIMLIGYLLTTAALLGMFFWGIGNGLITFILLYAIYIIGYTFQTSVTRAAQACLTNHPKQRPLSARFNAIYSTVVGVALSFYASNYLVPKHGGLNVSALQEMSITIILIGGVFTFIAIMSIWDKDIPMYTSSVVGNVVGIKDIFKVLKGNRAIQCLVIAASTDKLAMQSASNSAINIMVFGIIMGNYALYGRLNLITLIPSILVILFGTKIAGKIGNKKGLVKITKLSILFAGVILAIFLVFDPTQIGTGILPTGIFLLAYSIYVGLRNLCANFVFPMIADCTDYELYRTGKNVPGIMGSIFSFIDKLVSSLSASIVGFAIAAIGYREVMPQVGESSSPQIFVVAMLLFLGMPVFGWVATLIAMKFYPLDDDKMKEIQETLEQKRKENKEMEQSVTEIKCSI